MLGRWLNSWTSQSTRLTVFLRAIWLALFLRVFDEFHKSDTPEPVRNWVDSSPSWLQLMQAAPPFIVMIKELGAGEREAIALAKELKADAILIDAACVREARSTLKD